jgi:hypothetical protein
VNRLLYIAVTGALLVFGAAAQDAEAGAKAKVELDGFVQMKMVGAVKGMTVKGVPYSAEEVNETNQTLADGTHIHREAKTAVFRDSQGRTHRETPDNITITDPVANVTYFLDPKTMTGQKLPMASGGLFMRTGSFGGTLPPPPPGASTLTVTSSGDGPGSITVNVNGVPLDEKAVAEAMAKAKASGSTQTITYERREVTTAVGGGSGSGIGIGAAVGAVGMPGVPMGLPMMDVPFKIALKKPVAESLGKQTMEGVNAEGTRYVSTIEVGAIGNDRPIQISSESWYSADLQMMIMSKHSDPRTGDETFRVTNINRGEPAAYLFQLPAGYQIAERK